MNNNKIVVISLAVIVVIAAFFFFNHKQQVEVMSPTDVKNPIVLADKFNLKPAVANEIVKQITTAKPVSNYSVNASPEQAVKIVEQQIKTNSTPVPLPPADKTAVVADTTDVKVYRINLNKTHKIKVGASVIDNNVYTNIGYQQDRLEVIAHTKGTTPQGFTAMYTLTEW